MRRIWNKEFALWGIVLLMCVSCGDPDLFNTDKWSDKIEGDWSPAFKAPVAYGEFTLWDLLQNTAEGEDSPIQKVPVSEGSTDSMLVVQYTQEDIYEVELDDIFKLDNTSFLRFEEKWKIKELVEEKLGFPIPEGVGIDVGKLGNNRKFEINIEEQLPLPEDFEHSQLSEVVLKYKLSYVFPALDDVTYRAVVSVCGESFFEVNSSDGTKEPKEFETKVFKLTDNKITLHIEVELISGTYRGSDLKMTVNFSEYDFEKVVGKIIKETPIVVEGDPFKLDNEFLDDIEGSAKFQDPQVIVTLKNKGIGVDAEVDLLLSQDKGQGENKELDLNGLKFAGNSDLDLKHISDTIDKKMAAGISDFFALPLKGDISYSGEVVLNPKKEECVIYKDGSLSMDVEVVIPLSLEGNLVYKADLGDVNINIDEDYTDKIDTATLTIQVRNDLPLDLSIPSLILINDRGTQIGKIEVSSEDKEGIKAESTGKLIFPLSKKILRDQLNQTNNIQLEIMIANEDAGKGAVLANDKVKFTLSVDVKGNLEDFNF